MHQCRLSSKIGWGAKTKAFLFAVHYSLVSIKLNSDKKIFGKPHQKENIENLTYVQQSDVKSEDFSCVTN